MRRYELMLVIRPDVADDKSQALVDRTTRGISAAGGQIVKVAPWGRRRLAYPIDRHREGSYHIILFEAPSEAIVELEHTLLITEEVLRHLVTRVDRPAKASAGDGSELDDIDGVARIWPHTSMADGVAPAMSRITSWCSATLGKAVSASGNTVTA